MAEPDLHGQGGGGGGRPVPETRGGGLKNFFSALRALPWSKNKGGTRAPPLHPPLMNHLR